MGLLSALYGLGVRCKRFLVKPQRLPAKVISVGNITLGGTGKTPAVISIAEEARKRGFQPCILTRGYRGKSKGPCFAGGPENVSKHICTDAGDEPALMAERLRGTPIVKCADRYKGGQFAISNFKFELPDLLFILDDGFQHWRLHRDIDILLIDATNPFGNKRLFPEGRLREPLSSMKRANLIVLTKTDNVNSKTISMLVQEIRKHNSNAPVYRASHKPAALINPSGESADPDFLRNKKIFAFAGLANPSHFKETLISKGADIISLKIYRDHYSYRQRDVDKIRSEAAGLDIITTEKDLVKLRGFQLPGNIFALRIEFSVEEDFYNKIFRGEQ